jgi:hypothetical protein
VNIGNTGREEMGKINYAMELEIVEVKGIQVHHTGQEFPYPEDMGNVCPRLLDSVNGIVCVLQFGERYHGNIKALLMRRNVMKRE